MTTHAVVDSGTWLAARQALLAKEKEFTRAGDALAAARRELPWERVEKTYLFETPTGQKTLGALFEARSQLIVYHFMYGPQMSAPCKACSFWADSFDHMGPHLAARDVTFLAVSRAPLATLEAFRKRMGWSFDWVSSGPSDFNDDYHVSLDPKRGPMTYNYVPFTGDAAERPGISAFYKDGDGAVYHTYSAYARGVDRMNAAYQYLDLAPKGRDEDAFPPMKWLRYRDQYGNGK